jgi:hypothetical protein
MIILVVFVFGVYSQVRMVLADCGGSGVGGKSSEIMSLLLSYNNYYLIGILFGSEAFGGAVHFFGSFLPQYFIARVMELFCRGPPGEIVHSRTSGKADSGQGWVG